ncbi:(deoxy)nucleoside triphosphate pyrophosphohydrolase [Paenibacillus sp. strain BS8-2]
MLHLKSIVVAAAVIVNEDQMILCALRSSEMSMPGVWEFPGGKVEAGESVEACLVREIKEELGCLIKVRARIEDIVHEYPSLKVRLLTHYAEVVEGTPIPREHEELLWLAVSELETLNWAPADVPTVQRILATSNIYETKRLPLQPNDPD